MSLSHNIRVVSGSVITNDFFPKLSRKIIDCVQHDCGKTGRHSAPACRISQFKSRGNMIWITRLCTLISLFAIFIQNWLNPIMLRVKCDRSVWSTALPTCDNGPTFFSLQIYTLSHIKFRFRQALSLLNPTLNFDTSSDVNKNLKKALRSLRYRQSFAVKLLFRVFKETFQQP